MKGEGKTKQELWEEPSECDADLAPRQRHESRAGRATKKVLTRPVGSPHQAEVAQLSKLHCAPSVAGIACREWHQQEHFRGFLRCSRLSLKHTLSAASWGSSMPTSRMWFQNRGKDSRILEKFTFKYPFLLSLKGFPVFRSPQCLHGFKSKCHW